MASSTTAGGDLKVLSSVMLSLLSSPTALSASSSAGLHLANATSFSFFKISIL
jgi:hypothetical protein